MLADPVFSADDARIGPQRNHGVATTTVKQTISSEAIRSGTDPGMQDFARLRFSRTEAEEIARLAPAAGTLTGAGLRCQPRDRA